MSDLRWTRRDALRIGGAGLLGTVLTGRLGQAAEGTGKKVLYFTKSAGFEHSVVKRSGDALSHSEKILIEVGKQHGFEITASKDGRIFDGDHRQFDAYVFYTSGDLTKVGPDKAPAMSPAGKQALLDAVQGGKGFLGIHAASDSFHSPGPGNQNQPADKIDPYIAMLGGEFIRHGAQQKARMTVVTPQFPGFGKLGDGFELLEEWYALKNFAPDMHVLLINETAGMQGEDYDRPPFPATWARRQGKGPVMYTSLGHREDVWTNPLFHDILVGSLRWITGVVEADVPPNLTKVTPGASTLRNP